MKKNLLFVFILLLMAEMNAQNPIPYFDKRISISCTNESVSSILNRIAREGGFNFSYNSAIVPDDQVVTLNIQDKTIREVLNEIFKGSVTYKQKGNYIILIKTPTKESKLSATSITISGYVEDIVSGERIEDVSVYEKKSLAAVVTDEFGFFRLKLERKDVNPFDISISKKSYVDTTISITDNGNQYFHVALRAERRSSLNISDASDPEIDSTPPVVPIESIHDKENKLVLPYAYAPNVVNIKDTIYRKFQVSVFPFVGTNGGLSGSAINDYSFNIYGGYSRGTRKIEIGSVCNIDRGDVSYLQVAGVFNLTGGYVYGIQAAGFSNINGGEVKALEVAGFSNVNYKDFQGVQISGFSNINRAGVNGVLLSGFANYSHGPSKAVEVSGFANVHGGDLDGPQISGFANVTTGRLRGTQISGFLNYAKRVHGTQIGFINVADTMTGVPIGFLSFVKKGYHKIEVSADEVFYTNIAFRTGVKRFYNIITVGTKPGYDAWTFGYGVGTVQNLTRWAQLNVDLTSQQVTKAKFVEMTNSIYKLHLGFDFQLAKRFSIYGGVTLNAHLSDKNYTDRPELFTDYQPRIFHQEEFDRNTLQMWWGGKLALRFL